MNFRVQVSLSVHIGGPWLENHTINHWDTIGSIYFLSLSVALIPLPSSLGKEKSDYLRDEFTDFRELSIDAILK